MSGARIAPTLAPELNMPVAKDRSLRGKYSAVAFMAAGKFADSPTARKARVNINPITEAGTLTIPSHPSTGNKLSPIGIAEACMMAPIDHTTIAHAYPLRVPMESMIRPANTKEIA